MRGLILIAVVALAMTSAGTSEARSPFRLNSADFRNGSRMPVAHAAHAFGCTGKNVPPTLSWSGTPRHSRSFALTMLDVDAQPSPFVHWVVYNIPGSRRHLGAGLLQGTQQLANSTGSHGYFGPCPPSGQTHHYVFTLYAVSVSHVRGVADLSRLMGELKGHVLAKTTLIATYGHRQVSPTVVSELDPP